MFSAQSDLDLTTEMIRRESAQSLADFLGHVVIDARPAPLAWGLCWERWQREIVMPMVPAIEQMAGLRSDYDGPRSFFHVLPRGHDKTGLIGRLANWVLGFSRRPISGVAAAADLDQALLLLESMRAEIGLNSWLRERVRPFSSFVQGKGGKLQVIAADAATSSGLKSDLTVLDELTFWRGRSLFDVLWSGREKRPDSVFIIITNAGVRGSWQHELLQQAKADIRNWSVYEAPVDTTLAGWMTPEGIEAMRALLPPGHARRVLSNHWVDHAERPLLTFPLIAGCQDNCLWPEGMLPPRSHPELYIGVDVGRTQDRTVIWTLELVGDVAVTREIKVLDKCPFAEQKSEIKNRLNRYVVALRIDRGAIGYQLAEELELEYRGVCQGVQLTSGRQGQLALALKTAFERHRIRIPEDCVLQADLQLVQEVETGTSGVPVVRTERGPSGHADRFWAAALALYGIEPKDALKRSGVGIRSVRSTFQKESMR